MLCSQCGKEREEARFCPRCGAEQGKADPFAPLGDLQDAEPSGPNEAGTTGGQKTVFFGLGDLADGNSGALQEEVRPAQTQKTCGPFYPSGEPVTQKRNTEDLSGTAEEKPGAAGKQPASVAQKVAAAWRPFVWKKWMTAAGCVAVGVILGLVWLFWPVNDSTYKKALHEKIDSEILYGENLPLAYQYSNTILNEIDFKILRINEARNTASVCFTYVDAIALADSYSGGADDPNKYYSYCIDCVSAGTAPTCTDTIQVKYAVVESNGIKSIKVLDSVDLADVMTGGVASEYMELTGGEAK